MRLRCATTTMLKDFRGVDSQSLRGPTVSLDRDPRDLTPAPKREKGRRYRAPALFVTTPWGGARLEVGNLSR
ncbi:MAG: hypothetical protein ACI9LT_003618 [Pseudoalteromonas distincta]|jgi:hypothetical protein